ncbi:uncharacterized protein LOC116768702 [Danaus plexippus]|uniref:uncharacterized protein LOC116768702 n=1 Tax=Danaus plexippus TaxID=13037 RepID=UPI000239C715|nr:uncharacterized protein LOC116768702 [Danaus plexippus]XP_061382757.1 uncharacterized protein LOC116768702 [Danaus plexippus]XP_061382760.1 uncharacterized protein LOC116768702 [Danaus plexippus]
MVSTQKWWSLALLFIVVNQGRGQATDVDVRLSAPSWVARGGSATLRCLHQVPPQLLYKVEFLSSGSKLLQYVRERVPPYTNYTFHGGKLNMSLVTENSITIDNLDPTASGLYWCEVSLETPIFTAASPPHQLTVVYSQKHPPIITFGKPDVVVGGLLRANCTSAPAAPPPRLTWYIDNEKVPEESIRYFSYRVSSSTRNKGGSGYRHRKHQHRYIAPEFNYTAKYWALVSETTTHAPANMTKQSKCTLKDGHNEDAAKIRERPRELAPPPISLWVSIAELRTPAHGRLQLTCTSTIPDEVGPGERFADVKKQTVTVAVNELSLKRPRSETSYANATSTRLHQFQPILLISCGILLYELQPQY